MGKEFLRNITQKAGEGLMEGFMRLPYGVRSNLLIPVIYGVGISSVIYSAVRGRFDREHREAEMQYMQEESFLAGDHWFVRLPLMFWSGRHRKEALDRIDDGLELREARTKFLDSMSDLELARYALGNTRHLPIPRIVEGEIING